MTASTLTGSSSAIVCGSPSSAAAMPSRWPVPSEKVPALFFATLPRSARSTTSSPRRPGLPCVSARILRWLYADARSAIAEGGQPHGTDLTLPLGRRTHNVRHGPQRGMREGPRIQRHGRHRRMAGRVRRSWRSSSRPRSPVASRRSRANRLWAGWLSTTEAARWSPAPRRSVFGNLGSTDKSAGRVPTASCCRARHHDDARDGFP